MECDQMQRPDSARAADSSGVDHVMGASGGLAAGDTPERTALMAFT